MLSTRSRSLTAIAAGALLLAPLAGCGSATKSTAASAKSTATSSSSPSTGATTSGAAVTGGPVAAPGARLTKENLVATMVAAMREKKTAHMVMQLGSSMDATADLRYSDTGTTTMKMQLTMGSTKAEVILVDGVMYIQQTAGGKFVKIDKSDPSMGNLLQQMSSMGPEASVAAMKDGLKTVEYAGTEKVSGDELAKYHVTVDTAAVTKSLGAAASAAGLPKTVTYDLFVDGDNLMRGVDMNVAGQKIHMAVTDWGKPVEITAPPASQIQAH